MTLWPYTDNIPFPTNSPSADQPNMLINTNSIDSLLAVDHVSFNLANGGYHNDIHFNTQLTDPAAVPTIGQLYTKSITFNAITDAALFYENGAGVVTQLTSPSGSSALANGYTFLPGGILMQWGSSALNAGVAPVTVTTTINFPVAFPTAVFMVTGSPRTGNSNRVPGMTYAVSTRTLTTFDVIVYMPVDQINTFEWIAIGN
jgi:hypothetical protein